MSPRPRRRTRANEFYETPPWATRALVEHVRHSNQPEDFEWTGTAFEPCAGDGAIARVLEGSGLQVWTADLDPAHQGLDLVGDARAPAIWDAYRAAHGGHDALWVVTNPPFSQAFPILRQAMDHAELAVAFFLRMTFKEPTRDKAWWLRDHWPDFTIGLPRFSWDDDGNTDMVNCEWMIWYTDRDRARALGLPFGGTVVLPPEPNVRRRVRTSTRETVRQEAIRWE